MNDIEARFWAKVCVRGPDECWPWLASRKPGGYGQFKLTHSYHGCKGKMVGAHRLAWELTNQASILPGYCICHHCDNPICCNPAHLFLGTHADNSRDRNRKGRAAQGRDPKKWVTVECLNCGSVFDRKLCVVLLHPNTFCSKVCYRQSKFVTDLTKRIAEGRSRDYHGRFE